MLKEIFKAYYKRGLIYDLLAILPFNLIFGIIYDQDTNIGFDILRVLRMGAIGNLPYIFEKL